ncbi:MAG: hypothetical protein QF886_17920, partial [Planctomycetota bacterium]|nr:hypothetical protein [Planctomycetota bacterium]
LPAGFEAEETDFDRCVRQGTLARVAVSADEIIIYLDSLGPSSELEIRYFLTPAFPCRAKLPSTEIYEYYTPENRARTKPLSIIVGTSPYPGGFSK